MFSSFVKQMVFKDEEDAKKYKPCHLRRQAIVHFLCHCSELEYKDWIIKNVMEMYGGGEDNLGPFSVKTYFECMVQDDTWGDI